MWGIWDLGTNIVGRSAQIKQPLILTIWKYALNISKCFGWLLDVVDAFKSGMKKIIYS